MASPLPPNPSAPLGPLSGLLAELGQAVGTLAPSALVAVLGDLTALQARIWVRLLAGAAEKPSEAPEAREGDRLLTIPEIAAFLGVPKGYTYELARRGDLPTVRVGTRYLRVSPADLQAWLARTRREGPGAAHSAPRRAPAEPPSGGLTRLYRKRY